MRAAKAGFDRLRILRLAAGYPIASGVMEGACRHLVKDRMERTGMRWSLGAKGMLFVRPVHASELWKEFVAFRRRRDFKRNRPYRELRIIRQITVSSSSFAERKATLKLSIDAKRFLGREILGRAVVAGPDGHNAELTASVR